ncbi:MAG: type II toxin-antitoxin system RelE/ParE family toxin [Desulfobacteraceae bacterium]|nr:type II toxin-antitoxin system RelE/ParE family toxin [Desulfobacteraceae bacterium]
MAYKIKYIPEALKQLSKLDKTVAKNIIEYMKKRTEDPTGSGKPLRKDLKGYWRHRVGNYRVVSCIEDDTLTVLVIRIGHRKDVYL